MYLNLSELATLSSLKLVQGLFLVVTYVSVIFWNSLVTSVYTNIHEKLTAYKDS